MLNRLQRYTPLIVLAASIVALFYHLFLGEVIFWGVPILQFYPWEKMAFDQIRQGQLPLWNPMVGNGTPLLANYQTAVFYPPNWLYLVIPAEFAMGLIGVMHIVWAGLGMKAYLRNVGISELGQSVGMLSYALGGYLISRFAFQPVTAAVSWLPWLMWAVDAVISNNINLSSQRRRMVILAAVIAMILLSGHAQSTFYSIVLALAYSAWRLLSPNGISGPTRWRTLFTLMIAAVFGTLISAIQLLPTAELLAASQRAEGIQSEAGLTYSFWPWRLLTLFAPNLFGTPAADNFDGYGAYWEDSIYVGILPLIMAGHGVQRWLRERVSDELSNSAKVVPFFLMVLPITFIFALGKDSTVFVWLFENKIPGFSTFQGPTRWMLLAVFALGVLAALGIDSWRSSERGMFWTRLLTAGGISLLLACLVSLQFMGSNVRSNFVPAILWLGVWVIVGGILGLLQPQIEERPSWRPAWEIAVLIFVAADLVVSHWGLTPTISPSYYHRPSELAESVNRSALGSRTFYLPAHEVLAKFGDPRAGESGFLSLHAYHLANTAHWNGFRDSLLPNLGMIDGVPSANNFDPLLVASYTAYVSEFGNKLDDLSIRRVKEMGVGVLLTAGGCGDLNLLGQAGDISACGIPEPWPRASLAACTPQISGQELTCDSVNKVLDFVLDTPTHIILEADVSEHQATLLLLDTYYPGWVALVDGEPTPIFRANTAFRAIVLNEGHHSVEFLYRPLSLTIGAILSLVALVAIASVWILSR